MNQYKNPLYFVFSNILSILECFGIYWPIFDLPAEIYFSSRNGCKREQRPKTTFYTYNSSQRLYIASINTPFEPHEVHNNEIVMQKLSCRAIFYVLFQQGLGIAKLRGSNKLRLASIWIIRGRVAGI